MENHHTDNNFTSPQVSDNEAAANFSRPKKNKDKTTIRSCIVTREEHEKADLLRFVCHPSGELIFDLNQKLPGRGLYVMPEREYLEQAISKNLFSKAAKRQVIIPANILTQVETQLRRFALDHLGLTRRAGDLILSLEKIEKYIKINKIDCYITSSSKTSDGYKTITTKAKGIPVITEFSSEELSKTLNLDNPVHMVIKSGNLAQGFLRKITIMNKMKSE